MDRTCENAESQTTANLQRASGFCWLQDFPYQTNKHLFQCRLAVELLLLLKLPPKYHTFHKTCAALQPLCPGSGHPQTECSVFSVQWQLSFGEVSFSQSMNRQWWHKVSPPGIMIQVGAVIPWGLNSGSVVSPRDRSCSSHGTAACVEESTVPQRGQQGKVLTQSCFEEKGRKRPLLPFLFLLLPPSTLPSGKHPCLQLNSWDWRVISHTDQEEHFWFSNITHSLFAFWSVWFCPPSPNEAVPGPSSLSDCSV